MSMFSEAAQSVVKEAVALAPDGWVPGGTPDPLIRHQHGHLGKPVSRIDGPLKVAGRATFAAEVSLDRMCYAALAYSTVAKGRIVAIETAAAEAAPGVVLVMTHRNAPKMKAPPKFLTSEKAACGDDLPVMQDDRVHWNGQPIAIVLAETQEQADHAKSLITATFDEAPATTAFDRAIAQERKPDSVVGEAPEQRVGDAEAALAAAPFSVDAVFRTPRHNHNAIEPHAVTLAWDGDRLHLHDTTQLVSNVAWSVAQVFGLKEEQVRVSSPYVGGGFGGKTLWRHQILAAAASRLADRPVRMTLSREGVYRVVGGRAQTEQRVAIGATGDGRFVALIHTGASSTTTHGALPEPFTNPAKVTYRADAIHLGVRAANMDTIANTFMRAPGESVGGFALECAVDELAERLGIDPVELRLLNEPEKDPLSGLRFSSRRSAQAWRAGADRFGWRARTPGPGLTRDGEWLVGLGCAAAAYPYQRMAGGAARITLRRDGHAVVELAAHEMGMGTATVQTQVCAERLGLELDQVTFRYGDSSLPGVVVAGGSQQTASIGAAVIATHRALVTELLKLAGNDSPLAGLKPEEVSGRDGGLAKLDEPARQESYGSILARARRDEVCVEASAPPPLELLHWSMHSYGAVFCEVAVNAVTGEPRVRRLLGSYDCGRILNAKTAASQLRGGQIMGLGQALMEETQVDERNGRILNPSLAEYHVPVHMDVPQIDVIWTVIPDPHAPMGARGVGEIGITGVAAAVANAIHHACGKRIRELPITLDKLM